MLGVALAADIDPAGRFGDLFQLLAAELDIDCAGVLLKALDLRGSWDRHDPGVLGEQPGQRYLRGGSAFACGGSR